MDVISLETLHVGQHRDVLRAGIALNLNWLRPLDTEEWRFGASQSERFHLKNRN